MKKVILYRSNKSQREVEIDYNETNLEIAKREAIDGKYSITEVEEEEGFF